MANENKIKANSWFQRFAIAYTLTGDPAHVEEEVIADTKTIRVGDPVTKATNVIDLATDTSSTIYGVALGAGLGVTAGTVKVAVAVADRNTVFVGRSEGASNVRAEGDECDIVGTGTTWRIECAQQTENVARLLKRVPGDDITDVTYGGRYYFVFARSSWDNLVAAEA